MYAAVIRFFKCRKGFKFKTADTFFSIGCFKFTGFYNRCKLFSAIKLLRS